MLVYSLLALLTLLCSTAASPSPSAPPPPTKRHTYAQYLAAGHHPHRAPAYGFEDPHLAAHYDERDPAGFVGSQGSVTWLEEMAVRGKKPDEAPFPPWETGGAYWGLKTFGHLPPVRCMTEDSHVKFDVAILGAPFDTATSYRPGARFGPGGIRNGAQRLGGSNRLLGVKPFEVLKFVDCGDSRMSFYSNDLALKTLEDDYRVLVNREVHTQFSPDAESIALDGRHHPRVMMLGGDHTIVLPALRALYPIYGPISVIHFDSHCDSRHPRGDPLTHGDYFYFAAQEGLLRNTSIHAGIRVSCDEETDTRVGFSTIVADEIEDIGWKGVIKRIRDRVGDSPVYLTIDIDTLDPAFAPATGTPEIGGWTSREMKKILHGLKDLKIVGADVVEVAPAYDDQAEITQIAAAGLSFELLSMMALTPLTV